MWSWKKLLSCALSMLCVACTHNQAVTPKNQGVQVIRNVVTEERQSQLTPDQVLNLLKEGNSRFVADMLTQRVHSEQVRLAAMGQYPKGIVLSCIDSRVPIEDVFDLGIGDIFVARVAGNFENTDILGSMEYACKVAGSKLIVVLGHEQCGAIKGAVDGVKMGNITPMLKNIQPAIQHFHNYPGIKSSKNPEFVHLVAEQNVWDTIDNIRERSPILKEMEQAGQIKIVGGMYDMNTGTVTFYDQ